MQSILNYHVVLEYKPALVRRQRTKQYVAKPCSQANITEQLRLVTALGETNELLATVPDTEEGPTAFVLQADNGVIVPTMSEPVYNNDACGVAVYSVDKLMLPGENGGEAEK